MEPQQWHRLFGLSWRDFFHGQPVRVEVEKDLSERKQFLDLVIVFLDQMAPPKDVPDGFDNMGPHNLISFRSFRQPMTGFTLDELVGHSVNYRKQVSPTMNDLLPLEMFRRYAVCARFPENLEKHIQMMPIRPGVFELHHFGGSLRLIVIHQLPKTPNNAWLHLFSAQAEQVDFGIHNFRPRSPDGSTLIFQLFKGLKKEGINMPYTIEDQHRDAIRLIHEEFTAEELLAGIPEEKRLAGISEEKRLDGIPEEKRLAGISEEKRLDGIPEEKRLHGIPVEKRLEGIAPEAAIDLMFPGITSEKRAELIRLAQKSQPTAQKKAKRRRKSDD